LLAGDEARRIGGERPFQAWRRAWKIATAQLNRWLRVLPRCLLLRSAPWRKAELGKTLSERAFQRYKWSNSQGVPISERSMRLPVRTPFSLIAATAALSWPRWPLFFVYSSLRFQRGS
jgi:hypothetical protein